MKKERISLLFLCAITLVSLVSVKAKDIKIAKAADKVFAYGDVIEYDPTTLTVSYDRACPGVDDVYGSNNTNDLYYQGRQVQLDPGKEGLLLKSKKHGVAAEGTTFRLGGEYMSGPFSIDFRVFSKYTYQKDISIPLEETLKWDDEAINPYLDLRKVSFKFSSYDDPSIWFKVYFLGTTRFHRANISTYIELGAGVLQKPFRSKFYSNGSSGSYNYSSSTDLTQTRQVADNEDYYWMTIPGTSFCNVTDIGTWMYTEGCASTVLKLDPESGDVSTEKYYKTGDPKTADIYTSPYYREQTNGAPNSGQTKNYYRQVFNGNYTSVKDDPYNLILNLKDGSAKNMSGLYKKIVPETTQEEMLAKFAHLLEKYTVDVTFEDVTSDKTEITPNLNTEPITYNRYANMIIYSLNGTPLTGEFKDSTPPRVVLDKKLPNGEAGKEYTLPVPFAEDSYDKNFQYNGYAIVKDPDGENVVVTDNKFTPIKSGQYLISWENIVDEAGNKAIVERTITVPSAFKYSGTLIDFATVGDSVTIPTATVLNNSTNIKVIFNDSTEIPIVNNSITVSQPGKYQVEYSTIISGNNVRETKQFEVFKDLQSKFISNYSDDFVLTNGYVSTVAHDQKANGLLITTKKSGTAAEGAKLTLVENMNGKFSIDFRVLSEKTLGKYMSEGGDRQDAASNPYLDLRRLGFKFTAENGDTFTVYIRGLELYFNYSCAAAVQTGTMPDAYGIKYGNMDMNVNAINDTSFGYCTNLLGSTFSNYAASEYLYNDQIIPTYFEFDPSTMIVAGKRTINGHQNIATIRDLSNKEHVFGAENVLTSFENYKVEMFVDEMTSNSYKTDGEAYDRYGRIVIYNINGQSLTYNADGYIVDNVAPIIINNKLVANENEKVDITPVIYDFIDKNVTFAGKVYYCEPNSIEEHEIEATDGRYYIVPNKCGNYIIKYKPTSVDSSNNAMLDTDRVLYIVDHTAPIVSLAEGIEQELTIDYGIDSVPEIKTSDVVYSDNVSKTCSIRMTISGASNDFSKVGEYTITYFIADEAGNESTLIRKFIIKDSQKPVITTELEDITVDQWSKVVLPDVAASDNLDRVILVAVQVLYGNEEIESDGIDFIATKDGEYTVIFTAIDKAGNESSKQMKITVNKKEKPEEPEQPEEPGISEDPGNSDTPTTKGCKGVATGGLVSLFALAGILFTKKRKNN